jgi:hypothetical protein
VSRAENCVEQFHMHIGICQRAGYRNGLKDAEEKAAALTTMQALLVRLDPIVGTRLKNYGAPCGDPMGADEYGSEPVRLSEVLEDGPEGWSKPIRKELERLGWFLA